jgi:hypothetical protein
MTACAVETDESERNLLTPHTGTPTLLPNACSRESGHGDDVSDPALLLAEPTPILKHRDNESLPSYAYF